MTYKPNIRVAVDWDGDGFIHLNGTNGGVTPSPIENPLSIMRWAKLCTNASVTDKASYVINNDPYAIVELKATINTSNDGLSLFIKDPTAEYTPAGWGYLALKPDTATPTASNFFNTLDANTQYKIGFWAKADTSDGWSCLVTDYEHNTGNSTDVTTTIELSTDWEFFEITAGTPPVSNTHSIVFTTRPDTLRTDSIYLKGVAIYKASEPYAVVVGSTAEYDRLDNYITGLDWQLGTKDYYDTLAHEGIMTITVNNQSKLFSPSNTQSPLYGELQRNRKVVAQVQHSSGEWFTLWSGWTDTFNTSVGTKSDRKAVITCQQGVFRLREGIFSYLPKDSQTLDTVVEDLVSFSGWRSTAIPVTWWVNNDTLIGRDTYLIAESDIWSFISKGYEVYDFIGDGWNTKTKLETALKDVLSAEDATLFVTREGYLFLLNRYGKMWYGTSVADIDLGQLTQATYRYGSDLINQVEVFYTKKDEGDLELIWSNNLFVPKRIVDADTLTVIAGESEEVVLTFEYEEGTEKTITDIDLSEEGIGKRIYRLPKRRLAERNSNYVPEQLSDPDQIDRVTISSSTDGAGRRSIKAENLNNFDVYVDIDIYGRTITSGDSLSYLFEDGDAIASYDALHKVTINNKLVTEYGQAKALADLRLIRDSYPLGEFDTITILSKDSTSTDQILTLTLGDIVRLSDDQTAETLIPHIIVGERVKVRDGILNISYTTARIPDIEFTTLVGTFDGTYKFTI